MLDWLKAKKYCTPLVRLTVVEPDASTHDEEVLTPLDVVSMAIHPRGVSGTPFPFESYMAAYRICADHAGEVMFQYKAPALPVLGAMNGKKPCFCPMYPVLYLATPKAAWESTSKVL